MTIIYLGVLIALEFRVYFHTFVARNADNNDHRSIGSWKNISVKRK